MEVIHNLARAVILYNEYILFVKAVKKSGKAYFFLPGGHIEYNEPAKQTLARELKEEAAIENAIISDLIGVYECSWDNNGNPYHEINLFFKTTLENASIENPPCSIESHLEYSWQKISDLKELNILPSALADLLPQWIASNTKAPFVSEW